MNKKYKYTGKRLMLAALVNCIPAIAVSIIVFLSAKDEIISSKILCDIWGYALFSIFCYTFFCYVEYFLIDLFTEFLLEIHDIVAKYKQRHLPIMRKDLELNNIDTIDKYWDYIGNILKVRGMVFPVLDAEVKAQCEDVFTAIYENQLCSYNGSPCSYRKALEMMSRDTGYDRFIDSICDIEKYRPWIVSFLRK